MKRNCNRFASVYDQEKDDRLMGILSLIVKLVTQTKELLINGTEKICKEKWGNIAWVALQKSIIAIESVTCLQKNGYVGSARAL